jgi:hypothetical protein
MAALFLSTPRHWGVLRALTITSPGTLGLSRKFGWLERSTDLQTCAFAASERRPPSYIRIPVTIAVSIVPQSYREFSNFVDYHVPSDLLVKNLNSPMKTF